jgi:protein involved in polysaccharide export with SLBB domain
MSTLAAPPFFESHPMKIHCRVLLALLLLTASAALAQSGDEPRAAQRFPESDQVALPAETDETSVAQDTEGSDWLSKFLRENPGVAREMADSLLAQRVPPGMGEEEVRDAARSSPAISERVRRDPRLRREAVDWLVERGYVTEKEAQRAEGKGKGSPGAATEGDERGRKTPGASDLRRRAPSPPEPEANDAGIRYQRTPYPGLPSARDLYGQVSPEQEPLRRFGADAFRAGALRNDNIDLPAGPDYVLGPGDELTVDIWGGVAQRLARTVDREGRIALPEAGTVVVAGLTLAQARSLVEKTLQPQFRNAQVDLALARVRSVRVYVVGDVERPGAYDVSSLSTAMNALYLAGGPTARGSLRRVEQYRGKELIRSLDLYDLLLRGVRSDLERLQAGDTIRVAPVGPQVAISGMVRRPAIYELRDESDLAQVVEMAGGLLVAATLRHVTVERIVAHSERITVSLQLPAEADAATLRQALASFKVQDGDRVRIAPILPYSYQTVYLEGHVTRPGKYPYHEGMQIGELLRSYQDVLPEPATHAEIVRLEPPDYRPVTLEFDLNEVLDEADPIALRPFDTVRVFGRYEMDAPQVKISGEVLRPGVYPLARGMTAGGLLRAAGGFKRSAYRAEAELGSYKVENGKKVLLERRTIALDGAAGGGADVALKPGDELMVRELSGWSDIGASVTLGGEVVHPGKYAIQEGERLSSVIRRAGGFRAEAYPEGAVLERPEVKELAEKSRAELIRQVEFTGVNAKFAANENGQERTAMMQTMMQQQQQVLARLRSQPVSGRMVIHIDAAIDQWANTPDDVEMRKGDVLTVPKRPEFVLVSGQVYNGSALAYMPGKSAGWYLSRAGGPTEMANKKAIFIVRANGSVVSGHSGRWFTGGVLSTRLYPGDTVVVPEKILGGSTAWKNIMTVAQFASAAAVSAGVALR